MIRINLLPKEILERRKYERYYPWIAIAAGAVLAAIFIWYAVLALQVGASNREYQQSANTARELQTQAKAFFVFEEKEKQLAERRQVVDVALKGRVQWGKLANEVSLVLPSEVWLTQFMGAQNTDQSPYGTGTSYIGYPATLTLIGDTPDTDPKSMSEGYKSLAKTLVRLNDLPLLNNTWLTSSAIGSYPESVETNEKAVNVQLFTITSSVVLPDVVASTSTTPTSGSSAAPAPPSSAGQ